MKKATTTRQVDYFHLPRPLWRKVKKCLPKEKRNKSRQLVIAATNRPQALDPAFRRPGRFDIEIPFDLPDQEDREKILRATARKQEGSDLFPHGFIAKKTDSWTPAKLAGIWSSAARIAVKEGSATVDEEDYLIGYEQAEAQRQRKSQLGDQT